MLRIAMPSMTGLALLTISTSILPDWEMVRTQAGTLAIKM
jgi:hypothetical protein